ncbi:LacI family DNA-binding transcriptional regulator [Staphylococcus sp. FSL K6-3157]|uniref:LacI family DNA-binding transcriptional regulator n=1 Tax=Staphylococcus sp. FSL K6-3157 TaxID=2921490 RepID=UPI0030F8EE23
MVTIKDVAKMAEVSTATVSRILNNRPGTKPETEEKVKKIIDLLNYKPNHIAQSLSNKSSNLIALIIPNLNNPYFSDLVNLLESSANKYGYKLYLCNSNDSEENLSFFLESIVNNYIKTVIINSLAVTQKDIDYLENNGVKAITIDRTNIDSHPNAVSVNHFKGSFLATKYLIKECNCKHILFLSGKMNERSSINRFNGYQHAVKQYITNGNTYLSEGDFTCESGFELTIDAINKPNSYDAIACANDAMAIGAIRACYQEGVSIPKEVQIVGYDNCHLSQYTTPSLTTVNQLNSEIGDSIMKSIHENEIIKFEYEPKIVVRETTK